MKSKAHSPVALPVAPSDRLRQAGLALANAAQALLDAARVLQGDNSAPVSPSFSLTDLHANSGVAYGATVTECINDFLVSKARSGRSDRYLRALKNSLSKFSQGRSRQLLGAVTSEQIEVWLHGSGWQARTQRGYLGDVQTLYNFAVRRGYCEVNPARGVDITLVNHFAPGIHTPEQVRAVLSLAREFDLDVMRCLAVRYFAGLRASEAEALEEKDIKIEQGIIEVTAAKSKTRRRRLVTISTALNAWLGVGGSLPLRTVSKKTRAFLQEVRKAGLPWPQNAPRHSFCSYHLAMHENAGKTALEAGHSEQMLFQHYRALVTKKEAEKFWSIVP